MTETPADGVTTTPIATNDKPAKKAAAKKAAPDQGQANRTGASSRSRPTEVLKYAFTQDDDGNVTSLAACGSTDALFEYVKSNPGKAYSFIDGPKGTDIIAAINAL